jgi:uncharacterized membrane protein (UPF0136 family)
MIVVVVFVVYGLLLYAEAGMGYRQNGARSTLIAGIVTGTVVIAAAAFVVMQVPAGASVGLGVMLAMMAVFGSRYMRTRAFMPSGVMFVASLIALGILLKGLR